MPALATVNKPCLMAYKGIAFTKSRKVTPGCNLPLKRTNTDSGISKGITPVAAAKATKPEPAGKEIPNGKRVCESPPVPAGIVTGKSKKGKALINQREQIDAYVQDVINKYELGKKGLDIKEQELIKDVILGMLEIASKGAGAALGAKTGIKGL